MFDFLKRLVWATFPGLGAAIRERRAQSRIGSADGRPTTAIFQEIYDNNLWGGEPGEFYSGSGSDDEVAADYIRIVRDYMAENSIRSIVDLGCGDFRVGRQLLRPGVSYIGVDVVPEMIASHQARYGDENVSFAVGDIIEGELPNGELYLVRQVLQHLSNQQIGKVLDQLRGKAHAIIAEHHPAETRFKESNRDKPPGRDIRVPFGSGVYPDKPPFSFPCKIIGTTAVPSIITSGETISVYAKI